MYQTLWSLKTSPNFNKIISLKNNFSLFFKIEITLVSFRWMYFGVHILIYSITQHILYIYTIAQCWNDAVISVFPQFICIIPVQWARYQLSNSSRMTTTKNYRYFDRNSFAYKNNSVWHRKHYIAGPTYYINNVTDTFFYWICYLYNVWPWITMFKYICGLFVVFVCVDFFLKQAIVEYNRNKNVY